MSESVRKMLNLDPDDQVIEVDEDLPSFFECIKYSECDILLAENEHLKKHQDYAKKINVKMNEPNL